MESSSTITSDDKVYLENAMQKKVGSVHVENKRSSKAATNKSN